MGNCIRKESSMHWGGEDWSHATSQTLYSSGTTSNDEKPSGYGMAMNDDNEENGLLGKKMATKFCPFGSNTGTEVKIKITKKQLEELMSKSNIEGLSIQQLLAQLMNVSDKFDTHHRSWRPSLQSIPEAEVN